MSEPRPILVRLPNWVGDVVMAVPAIRLLEAGGFQPVLAGRPWITSLLGGTTWSLVPLPKAKSDHAMALREAAAQHGARDGLLLPNSWSSAWIARRAGLRVVGYGGQCRSLLLSHRVRRQTEDRHEGQRFRRLARAALTALQGDTRASVYWHDARLPLANPHLGELTLRQAKIGKPVIVIAPSAVGRIQGQSKTWPHFRDLDHHLHAMGHAFVACPGPGEHDEVAALLPHATMLPDLDLGSYLAVLERAHLVIANDSGPMHLAAAAGSRHLIACFGPGDPQRTRPLHPSAIVLGGNGTWPAIQDVLTAVKKALPDPTPDNAAATAIAQ